MGWMFAHVYKAWYENTHKGHVTYAYLQGSLDADNDMQTLNCIVLKEVRQYI